MEQLGYDCWGVTMGDTTATVTLIPLRDTSQAQIVELRIAREDAHEPSFYTRFELRDTRRAHKLFLEMSQTLERQVRLGPVRVLVYHALGERVENLLDALTTAASKLSVPYAFDAFPIGAPHKLSAEYTAIMLTPGIGEFAQSIHTLHPDSVSLAIPQAAFQNNDGKAIVGLLLETLHEVDTPSCYSACRQSVRPFPAEGRVLITNVMYCDSRVRLGYRVYEGDVVQTRGALTKSRLSMDDLHDFFTMLGLEGIRVNELDAMGFVTPGVVNFASMNLPSLGVRDYDLAERLNKHYGIPVFMENNCNAAAMGCYMLDAEHENLMLYRHQLGHKNGGQGTIVNGQLVTGRYNLAGEPKFYQRLFKYEGGYAASVWTAEGLSRITRNVILASIGTVSPDVAYIAVNAINDVETIRRDLERRLPMYCIPELVGINDYRDCMYLGAAALCLGRLA
ncbi:MAG: ROK family protein [Atopobiaceae bacterium]|nr:ROK family protein [Atopobiaceae bacterium]